jgi:hypothetical protein
MSTARKNYLDLVAIVKRQTGRIDSFGGRKIQKSEFTPTNRM